MGKRKSPDIDTILQIIVSVAAAAYQLWKLYKKFRKHHKDTDTARRNNGALVDGNDGHRGPQTPSANLKTERKPMLGISKIRRGINHVKTAAIKKIHAKTDYLLNTTSEQRKKDRKINRAQKRMLRLQRVREFRPFNWRILQKWQDRSARKHSDACTLVSD